MAVSTEVDHNDYTGNGVTTSFPYTFRIFHKSDLVVQVVDLSENITELTLDTDYTVTGAGGYTGGNVVLSSPLANGYQISISRELPFTQETDLRNQGKFFAEVHEDAFDKLTMLIQQVRSWLSLALRKPSFVANYYDALGNYIRNIKDPRDPQDAATKNYVDSVSDSNFSRTLRTPEVITQLPSALTRANKIVGFDASGNPIMLVPESGSAADVLLLLAGPDGYTYIPSIQVQKWIDEGDIRGWGCVCDGITDDTLNMQQAFNESQRIKIVGNPVVSGTILIRENQNIVCDGAVISTTSDTLSILYADNVDGWSISGNLVLERKGYTTAPTVRVESACGLAVQDCLNFHIDGVVSRGFAGSAFYFTSSSPDSRGFVASSLVTNCIAHHNYAGFTTRPGFASEYISFTGCISRYNYAFGVEDYSGNIQWTGGQVTHNTLTGFSVKNGYNDAHGNVVGAAINHNSAKAIEIVGTNNGFTFSGCSVFDNAANDGFSGAIYFDNCSGVVFSGCQIMADIVEVATSGRNLISNCMFANAPTRPYQHTVVSGGMNVLLRGCVRAGDDNLGLENAFGGSGIRFTRASNQVVSGTSGDVVFDSPSFAFGQIQYDTSVGSVNIFHAGQYFIDINVIVSTGSTGIYADVYKGSSIVGSLAATKRDGGTTHALCGRIVFGAGRGEKVKLNIRSDSAGFTVSSGSFIQVALID